MGERDEPDRHPDDRFEYYRRRFAADPSNPIFAWEACALAESLGLAPPQWAAEVGWSTIAKLARASRVIVDDMRFGAETTPRNAGDQILKAIGLSTQKSGGSGTAFSRAADLERDARWHNWISAQVRASKGELTRAKVAESFGERAFDPDTGRFNASLAEIYQTSVKSIKAADRRFRKLRHRLGLDAPWSKPRG